MFINCVDKILNISFYSIEDDLKKVTELSEKGLKAIKFVIISKIQVLICIHKNIVEVLEFCQLVTSTM